MTPERLAEIKARADAATPGPWHVNGPYASYDTPTILDDNGGILGRTTHYAWMRENAAFMAAARSDVPELVAEVERLREALDTYAQLPEKGLGQASGYLALRALGRLP